MKLPYLPRQQYGSVYNSYRSLGLVNVDINETYYLLLSLFKIKYNIILKITIIKIIIVINIFSPCDPRSV